MPKKRSRYPTELELEILKILWKSAPMTVREVRESLGRQGRKLAHTSLITTLNVMYDKGQVSRAEAGRGYSFSPVVTHEEVSRGMVGDLLHRVFEGSAPALMLSLLENESVKAEDQETLREAIETWRRENE